MKKYILAFGLVIIVTFSIILAGCSHTKEDKENIIKYLDDVYGKNSYTIKQDPNYKYNYLVNLKQYPELEFKITVSRQPLMSPFIWSDFDEVFSKNAISKFISVNNIGSDKLEYSDTQFMYRTEVNSLEELKVSYEKLTEFINFVSEKYPVIVDTDLLDVRLDIYGIILKGDIETETKYYNVCETKKGVIKIKSYDEIYNELAPKIKTRIQNSDGIIFRASDGRSFSLGGDTFEDCFYKGLKLKNFDTKELEKIILKPKEMSDIYTFSSTDNYNFVDIEVQAQNLTDSDRSLYDATIVKAVITGSKTIFIDTVFIDLEFDQRREWIDPYEALKISPPKTNEELKKGVSYKNIRVLFEKYESWEGIKRVTLALEKR